VTPSTGAYPELMPSVLVVDDDLTVAEVVVGYLERAGFVARHAADGESALASAAKDPPDLVILDLMLPGIDGLEVCRQLHRASNVPVVMLTALGEEVDRVLGLEVGADDYVTKPFSPRELVLRVQSVLRRNGEGDAASMGQQSTEPTRLADGDIVLEVTAHRATKGKSPLNLTTREFDLLTFLLRHPGRAFDRAELMQGVWGWSFGDQSTVTVHVRRLREKIERDPAHPVRLVTVWGVGYRWDSLPS
jgi:two-component system response regulator ResD